LAQAGFGLYLATVGRYAEARELGERTLAEAAQRRDAPFVGDVHLGLAQAYAGLGLAAEARAAFAQARRAFHAIGHHFMAGLNAANELRWVLPYLADDPAAVSRLLDEMDGAMAGAGESPSEYVRRFPRMIRRLLGDGWREGRELADAPGGTVGFRQTAWQLLAPILRAQGDADAAWALIDAVLPEGAATEPGDTWLPCGLTFLRLGAALTLDAGDPEAARAWLEAHDRWVAWSASPLGRADGHLGWAGVARAAGDAAAARRHAEDEREVRATLKQRRKAARAAR
jgi:tetratricopeptide (TPR) repeat protein